MKQSVARITDELTTQLAERVRSLRAEIDAMPDDLKQKVAERW